jgi:hypothetical protein
MKLGIWICGVIFGLCVLNYKEVIQYKNNLSVGSEVKQREVTIQDLNPITSIQRVAYEQGERIRERAERQAEISKQEAWAATKTKVYVRARDTKTCMRILKIDVINNEVAECNKDRIVEVRNDELEKFKKDNEL